MTDIRRAEAGPAVTPERDAAVPVWQLDAPPCDHCGRVAQWSFESIKLCNYHCAQAFPDLFIRHTQIIDERNYVSGSAEQLLLGER